MIHRILIRMRCNIRQETSLKKQNMPFLFKTLFYFLFISQLGFASEVPRNNTTPLYKKNLPRNESPCFTIHQITLTGHAAKEFAWALAQANPLHDPAIGQCLGLESIHIIVARITYALLERGFITSRIVVPSQQLTTGKLALILVPGRIRTIQVTKSGGNHTVSEEDIPFKKGDILNMHHLKQALTNIRRNPHRDAHISINPVDELAVQSDIKIEILDISHSWT